MGWVEVLDALVFGKMLDDPINVIRGATKDALDGGKIGLEVEGDKLVSGKLTPHLVDQVGLARTPCTHHEKRMNGVRMEPVLYPLRELALKRSRRWDCHGLLQPEWCRVHDFMLFHVQAVHVFVLFRVHDVHDFADYRVQTARRHGWGPSRQQNHRALQIGHYRRPSGAISDRFAALTRTRGRETPARLPSTPGRRPSRWRRRAAWRRWRTRACRGRGRAS